MPTRWFRRSLEISADDIGRMSAFLSRLLMGLDTGSVGRFTDHISPMTMRAAVQAKSLSNASLSSFRAQCLLLNETKTQLP